VSTMAVQFPKSALIVAIPVVLAAAALLQRRRNGGTTVAKLHPGGKIAAKLNAGGKVAAKRHKPKSKMRYYGLGLLINALERDGTRKAVIAGLKLAQRRA
jgi:hypothetical protein